MTPDDHTSTSRQLARRQILLGAVGAAAFAVPGSGLTRRVLASAPPASDDDADTTDAGDGTVATDAFPVEIEGLEGTVTLDAAPERVVSVGSFRDTDAAVALGITPLATPDQSTFFGAGISPWIAREVGDTPPEVFDTQELSMEHVATFDPDLILATDYPSLEEEYDLLAAIAPTLSYLNGYNQDEWPLTTTRIATAFGRVAEAERLIAEVDAAVAAARGGNPAFAGKTFTFGPVQPDGTITTINATSDASARFFGDLGFELSPAVLDLPQAAFPGRAEISPERLDLLDADVMLLTFVSPEARETLEANPLFQQLPAVQRGAYIPLDMPVAISMAFPSVLSILWGLEQVVPKLRTVFGE